MSEVLRVHAISMARQNLALFLVAMFCAMSWLPLANASADRQVDVEIGLGPNGISDQFTIDVPDGDIVTDFDVKIFEKSWPINDVVNLEKKSDWMNGYSMDGVDYNLTGLRILPMSHEWDFEGVFKVGILILQEVGLMGMIPHLEQPMEYIQVHLRYIPIMVIIQTEWEALTGQHPQLSIAHHVQEPGI